MFGDVNQKKIFSWLKKHACTIVTNHEILQRGYPIILAKNIKMFLYFVLNLKSDWNNVWWCSREKTILSCLEKHAWYLVSKFEIFQTG